MKALVFSSFLILVFLPCLVFTDIPLDPNSDSSILQIPKLRTELTLDISLDGNVYLSNPNVVNDELVDIFGILQNDGEFRASSYVLFTISNSSWKQDISGLKVDLAPNEEQYVKTSWMAIQGTYEITIEVRGLNYIDDVPENNIVSTVITVAPSFQPSSSPIILQEVENSEPSNEVIYISIVPKNGINSLHEIKPGETKFLNLTIISHEDSDDFRVIVGGITDKITIKPDSWVLSLIQGQAYDFHLEISVSESFAIGSRHNVELLLYRESDPSDIVQKSFDFVINVGLPLPLLGINQFNPPIIENISHIPSFPTIAHTVNITADIVDESTIINATLFYSLDGGSSWLNTSMTPGSQNSWSGVIPSPGSEVDVTYYIQSFDNYSNSVSSSQFSFIFDGSAPTIGTVLIDDSTPNYLQNVTITTQVDDNNELRNVSLYYSFDNGSTWIPVLMSGSAGAGSGSSNRDVLLVSHGQDTDYLSRNSFTFDSISESAFSSITLSTLSQYRILILEPNWSSYSTLRSGLLTVDQALDNTSLVVSIRVAGNGGSQADIDFLGTDYDRSYTSSAETIIDSNHHFISGLPWGGNTLLASYFNGWSSTDHGWFYNLPVSQLGYVEILQNTYGISMLEYTYKNSQVLLDTLTSIDGGWGYGYDLVADNFINYLNYTYFQQTPSFQATIPSAPANTMVQYYVNATDMANNSAISSTLTYFSDGSVPQITTVTEIGVVSELSFFAINATISDNWALDNAIATLVYTYDNSTYFQLIMSQIAGNETNAVFQAISPATIQPAVYYYIESTDRSGLRGLSGNFSYLVDRIPVLNSQLTIPTYPDANYSVIINATVTDDYGISSVILYHNGNSTWDQLSMTLNQGVYQGTIPATINDTNVDYIISLIDTFGHQINSSTFSYHSDALVPVLTSITHTPDPPNADAPVLVQALITDSSGIKNATLSYSIDSGSSWTNQSMIFNVGFWEGTIPALNQSIEVYYFVTTFDQANFRAISNQSSFVTDNISPRFFNLTEVGIVSELFNVPINVTLTDNFGVDSSNVLLFYSHDNSSWFSTAMSLITGDTLNGTYTGIAPSTSQNFVYYYAQAYDLSGRGNVSAVLNYTIDHQPIVIIDRIHPLYPSTLTDVDIFANITDDFGINQVTLHYYYNNSWQQTLMNNVSNQYTGTIGFTDMDTQVSYYVSVVDFFGHMVNSSTLFYYADGLNPRVENISYTPAFPSFSDDVTVRINVTDNQNISNATLYYTTNGTYVGVNVTFPLPSVVTGRDPSSGYYYGTTRITDYNTGPLDRLSIYVYSSDSDTLYVTLWGYRIDIGSWEQFHYSGSRGTGNLDQFTWPTPIYEQWRIQIYDSENNDDFYYSYEYESGYPTIIPATNSSATVQFYVEVFDYAGNRGNSSTFSYFTDADSPTYSDITNVSTASELTAVTINATLNDNYAVDPNQVILFYSYDQFTWFNSLMSLVSGTNLSGVHSSSIPATSEPVVYYYINASDFSGLTTQTPLFNYTIDLIPNLHEVLLSPQYPNPSTSTTVFTNITDDISLSSVTLLYEFNGTYGMDLMTESDGLYEATIPATAVDSLVNLSFVIVDSFGHNITNNEFFYYSDGLAPQIQGVITIPAYPNYLEEVTVVATISDVNDMRDVTLYYSLDSGSTWSSVTMNESYSAIIPVSPADTMVQYYVAAVDLADNTQLSGISSYVVDGEAPLISNVNQVMTVSELDSVLITATVSDNLSVDNSSVLLFYTYDNSTYYQSSMAFLSGNNTVGVYQGLSPATSQTRVYYYVAATDISELLSFTGNFSYRVDLQPIVQNLSLSPTYPSSTNDIFVVLEVTDDIGLANATIYYNYNSTWYNLPLVQQGSNYETTIPAINIDATFTYYAVIYDTFGHQITSALDNQYVDGIIPEITNIGRSPLYPINNTLVNITYSLHDLNPIVNSTIYYSINGSNWISITVNEEVPLTINGRDPPSGYYYGTTRIADYNSDFLERLSLYVYSADSDTLYVTLWGHRIDTGIWEQFHYSGSRGTGNLDEFTWETPIYNQWRIQIYDSENNDNFYYSYEYDSKRPSSALIPGFTQDTNITYFIQAVDAAGNHRESDYYSYIVDGTSPTVTNITQLSIVPAIDPVDIEGLILDRGGINESLTLLYYSFDNITWFNIQMTKQYGTVQNGGYLGVIPASVSETTVYYYIYVEDFTGKNFTSPTYTYLTLDVTITLQSPVENTILNGTVLVDFEFLVHPNTSILEISFDQGGSWINMTNTVGDMFTHTLNTSTLSEGSLDVWLNVTVIPNVSFIRTFTYYIDRSIPQIVNLTNLTSISALGQTIYTTISDAVISENMTVILSYTYNNVTWYDTQFMLQNQTTNFGTFSGAIPAASGDLTLSYYVIVVDELGWSNQSSLIIAQIDYQPSITNINQSLDYVRSNIPVMISVLATDDYGILNVSLYYNFDNTNYSLNMTFQNGSYHSTIPSTLIDTDVSYFVRVIDSFLHQVDSASFQYYSDGFDPNISYIIKSPSTPNMLDSVNIYSNIEDKNLIRNATLFYTLDNITWFGVNLTSSGIQTITERNPLSGTFYNETRTVDYASGPFSRLSIYTYSSDSDSLAVTLWGLRIDTGTWEQFYTSTTLGTGFIPEFNWATIVYEQWRIEISDTESDDEFYYSFEYDIDPNYFASIPASSIDSYVKYYIFVADMSNRSTTTVVQSYYTDGVYPTIIELIDLGPVSQFATPRVYVNISDNYKYLTPRLYYSTDEITWFSQIMTLGAGNMTQGRFYANIPAFSEGIIAYYVTVQDLYGLSSSSLVRYYVIDTQPEFLFITHFPATIPPNTAITVTAFLADDNGITDATLYYWVDGVPYSKTLTMGGGSYQAVIDPIDTNANVNYLVNAMDTIGHSRNSSITSFVIDGLAPSITFLQYPFGNISQAAEVPIEVRVTDNFELNMAGTSLYISFDKVSWTSIPMQVSGGTTADATFSKAIPAVPTNIIYYYIGSFDIVGLSSFTEIKHFYVESFPDADGDGVADWTELNVYNSDVNDNDTDNDGLFDFEEIYIHSTNATNQDTDNDKMPDGWEIYYNLNALVNDANNDPDKDGLVNIDEHYRFTHPRRADTDRDEMTDGWEVNNNLNPLVKDGDLDPDDDGLINVDEFYNSANPNNPDTDSDKMTDGWEVLNGLQPAFDDSLLDADNDNLSNLREFNEGTNPQTNDTDADMIPDDWEVLNLLNPLENDTAFDPDTDGLTNFEEYTHNTNPHSNDTDQDLMPDGWEVNNDLDPLSNDADLDADADGFTNLKEFMLGTNPNDPTDPPSGFDAFLIGLLLVISIPLGILGIKNKDLIREQLLLLLQRYRNR